MNFKRALFQLFFVPSNLSFFQFLLKESLSVNFFAHLDLIVEDLIDVLFLASVVDLAAHLVVAFLLVLFWLEALHVNGRAALEAEEHLGLLHLDWFLAFLTKVERADQVVVVALLEVGKVHYVFLKALGVHNGLALLDYAVVELGPQLVRWNEAKGADEGLKAAGLADALMLEALALVLVELLQPVVLADGHLLEAGQMVLFVAVADALIGSSVREAVRAEDKILLRGFGRVGALDAEA